MKQNKQLTVAIAGLGSRGLNTYARCQQIFPEKMKIVAAADPIRERLQLAKEKYGISKDMCFSSAEDMLRREKLSDIVFICTQDRQHVPQALTALERGYDILLEKPISPDEKECSLLMDAAEKAGRRVVVCHDMDLMLWLTGKHCKSVTSFGGLLHFTPEHAPKGASRRCLDGCKARAECPYDAEKIYLTNEKTGPYGRCVYDCDNDVADHQVVNLEMEGGSTISMTMTAFTDRGGRDSRFMGTKGEVTANLAENEICITPFGKETQVIDVSKTAEDFSGHAGGDNRMMEEFSDIVNGAEPSPWVTSLEVSVESHRIALAAERSRLEGRKVVRLRG